MNSGRFFCLKKMSSSSAKLQSSKVIVLPIDEKIAIAHWKVELFVLADQATYKGYL